MIPFIRTILINHSYYHNPLHPLSILPIYKHTILIPTARYKLLVMATNAQRKLVQ